MDNFTAAMIAEHLVSFDEDADAVATEAFMAGRKLRLAGVRREGLVVGYVRRDDLVAGKLLDHITPFEEDEILSDSEPLVNVIASLQTRFQVFVNTLGQVGGIITRSDLLKPAVRMWLFGMLTIIEMSFAREIKRLHSEDWEKYISPGRVHKAESLQTERRRRGQPLGLLACLQFGDRGEIVARSPQLREIFEFPSRTRALDVVKQLQALRNDLAHAQDIVAHNFDLVVLLSENVDRVLRL